MQSQKDGFFVIEFRLSMQQHALRTNHEYRIVHLVKKRCVQFFCECSRQWHFKHFSVRSESVLHDLKNLQISAYNKQTN
jgi:hypothetical protein